MNELTIYFQDWFVAMIYDIHSRCLKNELSITGEELADLCAALLPYAMRYERTCSYEEMRGFLNR